MRGINCHAAGCGLSVFVLAAGLSGQDERLARPQPLGPGGRLEGVRFEIVHEGVAIPPFTVSYTLPAGRTTSAPDGQKSYSASLDPTKVRHGKLTVDLVPTINVRTDANGRQTIKMAVTYNNRVYTTPESSFRTIVRMMVNGQEHEFSSSLYTSCLDGATPVRLEDGTDVPIRDLVPGDFVLNPATGEAMEIAEIIRGPEPFPLYRVSTAGGSALFSSEHPIPTDAGFRQARTLSAGDKIVRAAGGMETVSRVEMVPPQPGQLVYNLRFVHDSSRPEDHLFLAGGLVVGDYWLQDRVREGAPVVTSR